jgi:hypothetical protein
MTSKNRVSLIAIYRFLASLLIALSALTGAANAQNPVPLINQPLVPEAIAPGSAGFTLTVNGTGFASGAVVNWNGSGRTTTIVSVSRLTASILPSDIANAGTASVTVVNPSPGGGTSNVVFFEVTAPSSSIALGAPSAFGAGISPVAAAVGDFNGDGKLDLAVANQGSNNVSVLLGNGDGTFRAAVSYGTGQFPYSVAVGDFNRDGKLDLAVANFDSNSVSVLLGNGDGTFRAAVSYGTGSGPHSVAVGDFNRDGKLDLAVANQASNDVSVLLGNGDGTFQTAVSYWAGSEPQSVAVGDFNGDGKLDLTVADAASLNVSVLLGNGDGTFQAAVNYGAGSGPQLVVVGDFNGDGKLDLAVANGVSNNVSVLLGNGDGTFHAAVDYGTGSEPRSVAVGDFNGDGKLDLAVGNFSSNNVSVLLGNGDGTFQAAANYGAGSPASVAVGDFNDDGRLDLAVADIGPNFVSVLLQVPVSLSPTSLNFPDQMVGTSSAPQMVTLTNSSGATLTISSIAVTGTNATDFSQTNTCDSGLPPGGQCTISITFKPTQSGSRTAMLSITDNAPGSQQTISLIGVSTEVELNPASLLFVVPPGQSASRSTTLTNVGSTTLNINGITLRGPGVFQLTNTCGSSVAAGKSCSITVTFKPPARGPYSADVYVYDNGGGSPQDVHLYGLGCRNILCR